jgi:hypothetical protein
VFRFLHTTSGSSVHRTADFDTRGCRLRGRPRLSSVFDVGDPAYERVVDLILEARRTP